MVSDSSESTCLREHALFIRGRPSGIGPPVTKVAISIADMLPRSMDEPIASASIMEGEATLYQNQFAASLLGSGSAHVDWEERQNDAWSWAQVDDMHG